MGGCQSCGAGASGSGGSDEVVGPVAARSPAELLNLGREAEMYFAKGGRRWYEEVSSRS